MHQIGKIRCDADIHLLYEGEQKKKGIRRIKGERVKWNTPDQLEYVGEIERENGKTNALYTAKVYSSSLKRSLRIVYVQRSRGEKVGYAILFSTDLDIDPHLLCQYYALRFQIEFLFRDAKQHFGLEHCQYRQRSCLNYHFNTVFLTLS